VKDVYPNSITKEKISTKNIYPKRRIVGEHMFERFDVDTLFFIFYFQKVKKIPLNCSK